MDDSGTSQLPPFNSGHLPNNVVANSPTRQVPYDPNSPSRQGLFSANQDAYYYNNDALSQSVEERMSAEDNMNAAGFHQFQDASEDTGDVLADHNEEEEEDIDNHDQSDDDSDSDEEDDDDPVDQQLIDQHNKTKKLYKLAPAPKGRKRSPIWKHFVKVQPKSKKARQKLQKLDASAASVMELCNVHLCEPCAQDPQKSLGCCFYKNTSTHTGNFVRHLRECHGIEHSNNQILFRCRITSQNGNNLATDIAAGQDFFKEMHPPAGWWKNSKEAKHNPKGKRKEDQSAASDMTSPETGITITSVQVPTTATTAVTDFFEDFKKLGPEKVLDEFHVKLFDFVNHNNISESAVARETSVEFLEFVGHCIHHGHILKQFDDRRLYVGPRKFAKLRITRFQFLLMGVAVLVKETREACAELTGNMLSSSVPVGSLVELATRGAAGLPRPPRNNFIANNHGGGQLDNVHGILADALAALEEEQDIVFPELGTTDFAT